MTPQTVQLLTITLVISSALALTCYKCDSSENKFCSYGLSKFTYDTVDCKDDITAIGGWLPQQCVKVVAKGKDGTDYVARGCMPQVGNLCKDITKTLSFFSSVQDRVEHVDCFPCDGDKCNTANSFTGYTLLGVLLAAFAFMF